MVNSSVDDLMVERLQRCCAHRPSLRHAFFLHKINKYMYSIRNTTTTSVTYTVAPRQIRRDDLTVGHKVLGGKMLHLVCNQTQKKIHIERGKGVSWAVGGWMHIGGERRD